MVAVSDPIHAFRIPVLGPYSWDQSVTFATGWAALQHQATRTEAGGLALSFLSDRNFQPVVVLLEPQDASVAGTVTAVRGTMTASRGTEAGAGAVGRQTARILSLEHDARSYPSVGERDAPVGQVMALLPGLRPVNFCSPYECAVWAVLSQRINQRQAAAVKVRLIAAHGSEFEVGGVRVGCIPDPESLLRILAFPGIPTTKMERLHGVARAALDGLLDADHLLSLGERAPAAVRVVPGIGAFWSEGIYTRACGVADVWPDEPLSAAALHALHGLGDRPSAADVKRITDVFRPWRTWVCVLLRVAAGRGVLPGFAGREGEIRRMSAGERPEHLRAKRVKLARGESL